MASELDRANAVKRAIDKKGALQNVTEEDINAELNLLTDVDFETPLTEEEIAVPVEAETAPEDFPTLSPLGRAEARVPALEVDPIEQPSDASIQNIPLLQPEIAPEPQIGPTVEAAAQLEAEQALPQELPVEAQIEAPISPEAAKASELQQAMDAKDKLVEQRFLEREKEVDDEISNIESEIATAKESIDGASIFKSGSTGQKILAGLAIFLGGLGQGPNTALQIINDQENKVIKQNQDLLSQYTKQLGSLDKAKLAIKSDYYDALEEKADQMIQVAHPAQKLKLESMKVELSKKKVELDTAVRKMANKASLSKGVLTDKIIETLPKEDKERVVRDEFGQPLGLADSKEKAIKLSEQIDTIQPSLAGLDKLEKFAQEGNVYDPTKRAEVETIIGTIVGALRLPITGPGILTDSERTMLKGLIGNPNKLMSLKSSNLKRLSSIRSFLKSTVEIKMRTAGVKSVKSPKQLGFKGK